MVVMLTRFDFHVRGEETAALYFFSRNGPARQFQFAKFSFDGDEWRAGIHKSAQHHVAADSGEAIEIGATYRLHGMRASCEPRRNAN